MTKSGLCDHYKRPPLLTQFCATPPPKMDHYPHKMLPNLLLVFFVAFLFLAPISIADVEPETELDGYKKPPYKSPPKYKPPPKHYPPSTLDNEPETTEADEVPQGYHKPPPKYKPPPKHYPPTAN